MLLQGCLLIRGQLIGGLIGARRIHVLLHRTANAIAVALYLTSLSDRGLSRSSVLDAAYGITWLHSKLGFANPVND